jgi:hypothetical protein
MSLRRGLQRLLHFSLDTAHQSGQRAAAEAKSSSRYRWHHLYQQYNTSSAPSSFEPSRLYPKQYYRTSEDHAFWGIVGISLAGMLATKTDAPGLRDQLLQHCRTSVEALYGGRVYTLLTSSWVHASAWHLAANLAAMAFYRRTVRLSGREVGLKRSSQVPAPVRSPWAASSLCAVAIGKPGGVLGPCTVLYHGYTVMCWQHRSSTCALEVLLNGDAAPRATAGVLSSLSVAATLHCMDVGCQHAMPSL